jgi:MYXO-CTERM domain-containing protein
VPPFFIIHNAVTSSGRMVNPARPLRRNTLIKGDREDITIEQIIAAEGPRLPAYGDSPRSFRVAFVLLTRIGERAADVVEAAHKLDRARLGWEAAFARMTMGRGTMCTQVSAPCGVATVRLGDAEVVEVKGNGNGVVEPGEQVYLRFRVTNDSFETAQPVSVKAEIAGMPTLGPQTIDRITPGETRSALFVGQVPADAACGAAITVEAESEVNGYRFRGFTQLVPGLTDVKRIDFESDEAGFTATGAAPNGWAYGHAEQYGTQWGFNYQPEGGRASDRAWWTGLHAGTDEAPSGLGAGDAVLTSPPVAMSGTYQPVLRYAAWFQANDFSGNDWKAALDESGNELAMVVEASPDDGATWLEIDRVAGIATRWRQRQVRLEPAMYGATLQVRFRINNPSPDYLVEAGIDDVHVTTLTQACNPNAAPPEPMAEPMTQAGCGCDVAARRPSPAAPFALVVLLGLLAARRRRRGRA